MDSKTRVVSVRLADGTAMKIVATVIGEQEVALGDFSFENVVNALSSVARDLQKAIHDIQPNKASVKFAVELAVESGGLSALIAKGSANANLEVSLEWSPSKRD